VGTSKEKVDGVDLDLPVVPVVESFGRFVKYAVRVNEEEETPASTRNAFEVLMASQQALQSIGKDYPTLFLKGTKGTNFTMGYSI
jgi:methyl coenzyme M reductase beta subunit